jgi:hypothetical protein
MVTFHDWLLGSHRSFPSENFVADVLAFAESSPHAGAYREDVCFDLTRVPYRPLWMRAFFKTHKARHFFLPSSLPLVHFG